MRRGPGASAARGLALILALAAGAGALADDKQDDKARKAVASALVDLARWCERGGLDKEALEHLDEAMALLPEDKRTTQLRDRLERGKTTQDPALRAKYEAEREKAFRGAARGYVALATAPHDATQAERRDGWLLRAVEMNADVARPAFDSALAEARAAGDWGRVLRLASAAPKGAGADAYEAARSEAERRLASSRPVLRQAKGHPMKYWLGLPKDWDARRAWPVLVAVDGAGQDWRGCAQRFMAERDRRTLPFLVVSLVRLNPKDYGSDVIDRFGKAESPGETFDVKGASVVAAEVAEEFRGEPKYYMTGFSAGGAATWFTTIYHPERLAASAPACGGFGMRAAPSDRLVTEAPERETLPVRVFQGVKDGLALGALAGNAAGIREQWKAYAENFERQGFRNVQLVLLDDVGHDPCVPQVLDFFASVLGKK